MKNKEKMCMKNTEIINPSLGFEQPWLMQEVTQLITVPACGLIVTKSAHGQVTFHDDEFPSLGANIGMKKETTDE